MANKIGHVFGFEEKVTKAGRTLIMLPAFIYELESKHFSCDFTDSQIPEGLLDVVKTYLKDNYPEEVKRSFGDLKERSRLRHIVSKYISSKKVLERYKSSLGAFTHKELVSLLVENIAGFGPIDELFNIPTLTDIHINSPNSIWIDDYVHGPSKTNVRFKDGHEYEQFIAKILNVSNTSYSLAKPQASGSLPRLRYDVIGFDLAEHPTCSLRIISKELRINEHNFIKSNQGSKEMFMFLRELMKGDLSLLVSGSTGSGKTELMRFLCGFIPKEKRLVTMEDTKELYLEYLYPQKNIVSWNTRFDFMDEDKSIDLSRLVKVSLRHHPNWLIVGETRGEELYHLVEASQTGHNVLTGIHSHEGEAVQRMITILQGYLPSNENLYGKKIVESLPINIHLERIGPRRIITKITEYVSFEQGRVTENVLFQYNRQSKKHEQVGQLTERAWKKLIRCGTANTNHIMFIAPKSERITREMYA